MKHWALLLVLLIPAPLVAHPGGLDSNGCHHDRKRGGYHCHGGSTAPRHTPTPAPAPAAPVTGTPFASIQAPAGPSPATVTNLDVWRTTETLLRTLGYFAGVPDALPDSAAIQALSRFRTDRGIPKPSSSSVDSAILVQLSQEIRVKCEVQQPTAESRLVALRKLKQQGLINDDEYAAKRKQILESI